MADESCSRCHEAPHVSRTGPLCGLCLVCIENDVIGLRAQVDVVTKERDGLRRGIQAQHATKMRFAAERDAARRALWKWVDVAARAARRHLDAADQRDKAKRATAAALERERALVRALVNIEHEGGHVGVPGRMTDGEFVAYAVEWAREALAAQERTHGVTAAAVLDPRPTLPAEEPLG